jgi:hypothetical protein
MAMTSHAPRPSVWSRHGRRRCLGGRCGMGKGMFYFKCDLSMMQDEKIEDVIDEY